MAWNESGNGKNPWDRDSRQDGPPDLDKIVRDWQRKLSGMFGKRPRGGGGGINSGGGSSAGGGSSVAALVLILLAGLWMASGFYLVDDANRGVVQRFGAYSTTTPPGLRWHLPYPIETVDIVNISAIEKFNQVTSMLTSDENIVIVDMAVQYLVRDPLPFLFQVADPVGTLAEASESAIREVIGKNKLDFILGEGRAPIAEKTEEVIQEVMNEYNTGIEVTKVNLLDVNFPAQVEAAVQDAIKAREDKERLKFEADSYANDILPRARGMAVRQIQDAEAYKQRVIADAQGEAARFEALLVEYQKAPQVTRERLYIEAIEYVFANSNKVLLDAEGSGNLLYLPIDKLIEQQRSGKVTMSPAEQRSTRGPADSDAANLSGRDSRSRSPR
ncbi:MAG: FtsH protease activity modulator HflK [Gammaproteobacteria bacterium]|jgi:membrane protease subunit HflK|nr:FtsH protease activity modulator HflK [Gammaproteobacteria bacterium]